MRALIIGSGNVETGAIQNILKQGDIIICCDGGSKYLFEEGIIPHYIIGDLDSSIPQIIDFFKTKNVIFKQFDTKKDETDMELCLDFALGLNPLEIIMLGATGTRLDHTLGNINLLIKAENKKIKASIIDKNNTIYITNRSITITGEKGDIVSLLPITNTVSGITTTNLEYALNNGSLNIGKPMGVSNVMEDNTATITVKDGYLLVIKSID